MPNPMSPQVDERYAPYAALLIRLSLGAMWLSHAGLKVFVFTVPGFAGFLESNGLPAFMAWPVVLLEIGGGLAILAGFYGRFVSLILLPILIVATSTHIGNGWVFSNPGGGWEYPVFLTAVSLAHALLGEGAHALRGSPFIVPRPKAAA